MVTEFREETLAYNIDLSTNLGIWVAKSSQHTLGNMQSEIVSNRLILGLVAFSLSFGLSLVPKIDFSKAFVTGIVTVISTYTAVLVAEQRRKSHQMTVLASLHNRIKELEGLKIRVASEVKQIELHYDVFYSEIQQMQNQIIECRNQRDTLHRDIGIFSGQKKQLETEANNIKIEVCKLETSKQELQNSCSSLTSEKRRLELNCNIARSEIMQLQTKTEELKQEKEEVESNLSLLGRLKPKLEEKMYELRLENQEKEKELFGQNQLLAATEKAKEELENSCKSQTSDKEAELRQLQDQISILRDEHDNLQNQVWELLQQVETLNQESADEIVVATDREYENDDDTLNPFNELWESLTNKPEQLPPEWSAFLATLPAYEINVLKAMIAGNNPNSTIKQIAEAHITMPNLLIDSINEIANNTIGELIIQTNGDVPEIYPEHLTNVKIMIALHENQGS
jgi:hypothetical protein